MKWLPKIQIGAVAPHLRNRMWRRLQEDVSLRTPAHEYVFAIARSRMFTQRATLSGMHNGSAHIQTRKL